MKRNKKEEQIKQLLRFSEKAWCKEAEQTADAIINKITLKGTLGSNIQYQWTYVKMDHRYPKEFVLLKKYIYEYINFLRNEDHLKKR